MNLQSYLHYTESSASPESYHIWVYLSMISSILGKKAWIRCNYFTVYPNMYVILVSQPGVGKKSTAMRIGRNAVRQAELANPPYTSNDSQTAQALMLEMESAFDTIQTPTGKLYGSSPLTVIASELVSLLMSGQDMVDFLTDIYDADTKFEYKTKGAGKCIINNPCLTILSGVTTENLNSRIIKDAASGGLMSRSVIVYDNNIRPSSAFDLPSEAQLDSLQQVIHRFEQVGNVFGEFTFSPEAKKLYQQFELVEDEAMRTLTTNAEFRSRKPIHVLKCALLIAASELTTKIEEMHMAAAIQFLDQIEHNMKFIHMSSGGHKNAEIHSKVILALGSVEKLPVTTLVETFMGSTDSETIEKAVAMLVQVGWIKMITDASSKPPVQYLQLTDKGKQMFERYK